MLSESIVGGSPLRASSLRHIHLTTQPLLRPCSSVIDVITLRCADNENIDVVRCWTRLTSKRAAHNPQ